MIESNTIESYQAQVENITDADPSFLFDALKEAYPNLYMRNAPPDSAGGAPTLRYGFHTNRSTKSAVINNLIEIVREGGYVERDAECLDELMTYEQRQNGSYGAIEGKHDDMLMTRAIGLYVSRFKLDPPKGKKVEMRTENGEWITELPPTARRNKRKRRDGIFERII